MSPTENTYRGFRKMLRTFCEIVAYNYEHRDGGETRFTRIHSNDPAKNSAFNAEFGVEDGWNKLPDMPDLPAFNISLFNSGRFNTPGSAYINIDIVNICALFEKGDDEFRGMGSSVRGFRAGINERGHWLEQRKAALEQYQGDDKIQLKHVLNELESAQYNPTNLNPADFFTVEELGLDSDSEETTPQLKELLNRFLKLYEADRKTADALDVLS